MTEPREARSLVLVEIVAVIAIALVPWPDAIPVAIPLLVAASASRYYRRRSWGELVNGGAAHLAIGAVAGAVAVGLAVVIATPVVEAIGQRAVEWSAFPIVRGSVARLVPVAIVVAVTAVAIELALRGWLVERVLELSPGGAVLPVLLGAIAEVVITPGEFAARLGAGGMGMGLGWIYVAGGRSVVAPIAARVTFQLGAVVLEALRIVG